MVRDSFQSPRIIKTLRFNTHPPQKRKNKTFFIYLREVQVNVPKISLHLFIHVYLRRRNPYGQQTVQVKMRQTKRFTGYLSDFMTRMLSATCRLATEGGRAAALVWRLHQVRNATHLDKQFLS